MFNSNELIYWYSVFLLAICLFENRYLLKTIKTKKKKQKVQIFESSNSYNCVDFI